MQTDPTIEEALAAGEDTTGLGTVRDAARFMLQGNHTHSELVFNVDGRKVNVEMKITHIDGVACK